MSATDATDRIPRAVDRLLDRCHARMQDATAALEHGDREHALLQLLDARAVLTVAIELLDPERTRD